MNKVPFSQLMPTHADLIHILEQLKIETVIWDDEGVHIFYQDGMDPITVPRHR